MCVPVQVIRKARDPRWNEEFQFVMDEAPVDEKIHIQVRSRRRGLLPFHNKVKRLATITFCNSSALGGHPSFPL
jgi:hypothetical protein